MRGGRIVTTGLKSQLMTGTDRCLLGEWILVWRIMLEDNDSLPNLVTVPLTLVGFGVGSVRWTEVRSAMRGQAGEIFEEGSSSHVTCIVGAGWGADARQHVFVSVVV